MLLVRRRRLNGNRAHLQLRHVTQDGLLLRLRVAEVVPFQRFREQVPDPHPHKRIGNGVGLEEIIEGDHDCVLGNQGMKALVVR